MECDPQEPLHPVKSQGDYRKRPKGARVCGFRRDIA